MRNHHWQKSKRCMASVVSQNIWNGLCPIKEKTNIFINQSNDAKCNRKALQLYDRAATVRMNVSADNVIHLLIGTQIVQESQRL